MLYHVFSTVSIVDFKHEFVCRGRVKNNKSYKKIRQISGLWNRIDLGKLMTGEFGSI